MVYQESEKITERVIEIVKNNTTMSCGITVYSPKYNEYNPQEHGDITFILTETNEDMPLWRLNDLLSTIKKRLYHNGVSNIYCTYGGFNKVTIKCYYSKPV